MSGAGNENEGPSHRRSTRARKQREANPCEFLDEEEDAASAAGRPSSGASSSNASSNPSSETRLATPSTHRRRWHWYGKRNAAEFSSVDGTDKIIRTSRWGYNSGIVGYDCSGVFAKGEKELVAEQDAENVALEMTDFGSEVKLTQVPYHADLLPYYDYFAQGIQQHSDVESFSITNFHLPPSPWLGENVIPTLENSFTLTDLTLSNCSLSGEDLASLANFLQGNTTLCSLDLSRNDIESADTVKSIAKAVNAKSSSIVHVNLSYCALGSGDKGALDKLLASVKKCESLEIGHKSMDSEAVASIAKFVGKKNALTFFSLAGARLDKENKKTLEASFAKNKTIESLCLSSNGLALPGIFHNTKKSIKSMSKLTYLDLSFNSLPVQGAKALAKILEHADCSLETLILSNNHLTTKGANHILPALKENESLEELDLSGNWLNDAVAPAVVDLLQNNSTLLSLDLQGNKSLKNNAKEQRRWRGHGQGYETIRPAEDRGKAEIVKGALFDTTSLQTIANSNHTCAVHFSGRNERAETMRNINELDVAEGVKIRYKVVLALTEVNKDLYDPRSFNDVPLELMPYLITLVQQELGVAGYGCDILPKRKNKKDRSKSYWDYTTPGLAWYLRRKTICDPTLSCIFEVIMGWQSLPLLFVNGAGKLPKKVTKQAAKKKSRKRRRKFGEDDDSDDEPYIPKGARKTAKRVWDQETRRFVRIPAPVY
ncbi:hypothetical protein ACHAXT_001994 [Thalassiosira profunda]